MSSSFDWLELETLSRDIANLEDRLRAARSTKNHGLMRLLEAQLEQAKRRRPAILDAITRHAAETAAPPPPRSTRQKRPPSAPFVEPAAMVEQITVQRVVTEEPAAEQIAAVADAKDVAAAAASPEASKAQAEEQPAKHSPPARASLPFSEPKEGASTMWDQLTPDHLEQAKRELARRRAEMLARHAEELKGLEAEQGEIDKLGEAIATFTKKFARAEGAEVVKLEEERGQRMQA